MEFEDCSKLKEGTSLKLQNLDKKKLPNDVRSISITLSFWLKYLVSL
jgi:hypothetical protein